MQYPYCLWNQNLASLFGDSLTGDGVMIPLSDTGGIADKVDITDQTKVQAYGDEIMRNKNTNWAISEFGEKREEMFKILGFKQMVDEGRFYHLGLDVWVPKGTNVFAPIDGEVVLSDYEAGDGNYGGLVVMRHIHEEDVFYSVYGHLNKETLPDLSTYKAGDKIGKIGDMDSNGGYFYHIHLQILTQIGYENGFVHKGYATKEIFKNITEYCLDPRFLFKKKII